MDNIVVADKSTAQLSQSAWGNINLTQSSLVQLPVSPNDVANVVRNGQNLVVTLKSGERITIGNFFAVDEAGIGSDMVFVGEDGTLWQAMYDADAFTGFTFEPVASLDELMAGLGEAGSATPTFAIAGLGLLGAGGIAAASGGGGSGGGGGDPSDTSAPATPVDLLVSPNGRQLSGRGEAGSTVNVRDGQGNLIASGVVAGDGSFSLTLDPPVIDGSTLQVNLTDPAGNVSEPTTITTPDLTAPAQPTDLALANGVTLTGAGEPGAVVQVRDGAGAIIGSGQVGADGRFSVTLEPAQANGELIDIRLVDAAGNSAAPLAFQTPDITAPVEPSELLVSADGSVLTGRGEPGSSIHVVDAQGSEIGSAVVNEAGSFSVSLNPAQTEGQSLQVSATDAAGNVSASASVTAPTLEAPVDTTPPDAPVDLAISASGRQLSGRGEAGTTATVRDAQGAVLATGVVAADGTFSLTLDPAVIDGSTLQVDLTDAAGNVSEPSAVISPDLIPPAQPDNLAMGDGITLTGTGEPGAIVHVRNAVGRIIGRGQVDADGTFTTLLERPHINGEFLEVRHIDAAGNSSQPAPFQAPDITPPDAVSDIVVSADGQVIAGRGEAGATVAVSDANGTLIGTGVVAANGTFVLTLDNPVNPGDLITLTQTDAAGNVSPGFDFTVLETPAPASPTELVLSADGAELTGLATPGIRIEVRGADGTLLGSAVAGDDGSFTLALAPPQANGEILDVVALDATNQSSIPVSITAPDITAPVEPFELRVSADGSLLTGRGEPGSSIRVVNAQGVELGTAMVNGAGSFAVLLNPAQTEGQSLQVSATDAAGNVSASASVTAPNLEAPVDNTPPDAPTDLVVSASGRLLSGRGEAGTTVTVRDAQDTVIASGLVGADGTFSLTLDPAVIDGSTLQVDLTDAAGNVSPSNAVISPDLTAPAPPSDLVLTDGVTLTGTGEPGAIVQVRNASGAIIGSAEVRLDGGFSLTLDPAQANGEFLDIRQVDAAGNSSSPLAFQAPDITPPLPVSGVVVSADGLSVAGRGEAGATVTVRDANGAVIGTGVVAANGTFVVPLDSAISAGDVINLVQTDAAGNVSDAFSYTVPETPAPASPSELALSADGSELTGLATPGIRVEVRGADGALLGSAFAGEDGSFTIALQPPQANGEILDVVAIDATNQSSIPVSLTAPDITAPVEPSELLISADGSLLTGRGEPGSSIRVVNAQGVELGTAVVNGAGSFAVLLNPAQTEGQSLQVSATDAAGNVSASTSVTAPILETPIDNTPPDAPIELVLSPDGRRLTGKGEANTSVRVTDAQGNLLSTGSVGADGTFSIDLDPAVIDGSTLQVTLVDAAGNPSASSAITSRDLIGPAQPGDLQLVDGATLSGTGEAGARVEVRDATGTLIGSGSVADNGTFSLVLDPPQLNGEALDIRLIDAAGNSSIPLVFEAPDVSSPDPVSAIVVSNDGLLIAGRGEAGATVTVRDANGALLASGPVASDGSFLLTLDPPLLTGNTVTIIQTDAAGLSSDFVNYTLTAAQVPDSPGDLLLTGDGSSLSGSATAGTTVQVRDANGDILASISVGADGTFSVPLVPPQANGEQLHVVAVDGNGLTSLPVSITAPDITAPDAPSLLSVSAEGSTLIGRAEAGSTVEVRDAQGTLLGSAQANATGSFVVTLQPPQVAGQPLQVSATDAAGNTSVSASVNAPDINAPIDTTPPEPPTGLTISNDGRTLSGRGEPGTTVRVLDNQGQVLAQAQVPVDGQFILQLQPAVIDGSVLRVTLTDTAGNSASASLNAPDLIAPEQPTGLLLSDGQTLSGSAEAGARVEVRDVDGALIGSTLVNPDGSFTLTLAAPLSNGEALAVQVIDAAGNRSIPLAYDVPDTTPPSAVSDVLIDGVGGLVAGRGEAGANVQVSTADGVLIGSAVVAANGTFLISLTQPVVAGAVLELVQLDAAGNVSQAVQVTVTDVPIVQGPGAVVIAEDGSTVSGTAPTGSEVQVRDAQGNVLGSGQAGADGNFEIPLVPPKANGEALAVVVVDADGNSSLPTSITAPDITAPNPADNLQLSVDGTQLSGHGEPGTRVQVSNAEGERLGEGVVGSNGTFSVTLTPAQTDGQIISVSLIDAAGNVSGSATIAAPDLQGPLQPSGFAVDISGTLLTGVGQVGSIITVRAADNTQLGTATVGAGGTFSVTLEQPQRNGEQLRIEATDAFGNSAGPVSYTVPDTLPPLQVTALQMADDGAQLNGLGEAGATVSVRAGNGSLLGTALVGADGTFTVLLDPAQRNGQRLSVEQRDAAGNLSPAAEVTAPDLEAPLAPTALSLSADGVTLSGVGEPGATVTVRNAAGVVGSAVVAADGSFSVILAPAQLNGQTLTTTLTDAGGNVSPGVELQARDLQAPDIAQDLSLDQTGTLLSGVAEAGSTVEVRSADGTVLGTGETDADGNFSVTLPAQTNGQTLTVVVIDAQDNPSPAATYIAADTTPPEPAQNLLVNANGSQLSGTGEVGSVVQVRNAAGDVLGETSVPAGGNFVVTLVPVQNDGQALLVTLRDLAGNVSDPAPVNAPDTGAPDAPTNVIVSLDGTTVSGSAPGAASVTVRDANGGALVTVAVQADGSFSATLPTALTNGERLNVVATSDSGLNSAEQTVTAPDTTPPAAAVNVAVSTDGGSISGSAEPGSTVIVRNAEGELGQAIAGSDGSFVVQVNPPLLTGETAELVVVDPAGNESLDAVTVNGPAGVVVQTPSDLAISLDGFILTGQGTAGTQVTVSSAGITLGSATVGSDGSFLLFLTSAQLNGQSLQVTARDAAGTVSQPASITARDITAPDAPSQIVIARDGTTLSGHGEAGATVSVRNASGTLLGSAQVGSDGGFSVSLDPTPINGERLSIGQADAAGNRSLTVSIQAPDLVPPAAASELSLNAAATVVSGAGEIGASVKVFDAGGNLLATGTVNQNGQFQISLPTAQITGAPLQVTLTDAAGNLSAPATLATPDRTPPAAVSQLNLSADGSQLSGSGEPGANVLVRNAAGAVIGSATVSPEGHFTVNFLTAQNNGQAIGVTQVDAAGNTSPAVTLITPELLAPAPLSNVVLNHDGVTLHGLGQAGNSVTVRDASGNVIGNGVVTANGSFTLTLDTAQLNAQRLSVVQTDGNGTSSLPVQVIAPDLTPPAAPADLLLASTGLQLSGSAEAGSTVSVRTSAGSLLGSAVAGANGVFVITLNSAQVNGEILQVTARDTAGNLSPATALTAADITPPDAVSHLAVSADGASLTGHGETGATVTVSLNGVALGTAVVDADGHFSVSLQPAADPGVTLSVVQVDAGNNPSPAQTVSTPGALAPDTPSGLLLAADGLSISGVASPGSSVEVYSQTGVLLGSALVEEDGTFSVNLSTPQANGELLEISALGSDGTRSLPISLQAPDTTAPQPLSDVQLSADGLLLSGRGEAGATVRVTGEGGIELGTGLVDADGRFSLVLNTAQINGERISAEQRDAAGNISNSISLLAQDLVAPEPAQNLVFAAGGSLLQGTGEAGAQVAVLDANGALLGSATVRADGAFEVSLSPIQANGETVHVVLTDAAGNRSEVSDVTALDTTAPLLLSEVVIAGDGASLSGRGEVGAQVTVRNALGQTLGTAIVDASGTFTLALTPALGNAEVLSLTQTDGAGNVSPVLTLTSPDFTPPELLTNVLISLDGTVVTGRGEPGATVTVTNAAGVQLGTGVVQSDETFRVELSPAQINKQTLSVQQADPPGNISEPVLIFAPDRTPPEAPGDLRLNLAGDQLSGTGEAGATVRVSVAGVVIGTGSVDADGTFLVQLDTPLLNGELLQVILEDDSENTSLPTSLTAIDSTPPAQVIATLNADGTQIWGTGEAGARLTVINELGDTVGQGVIDADGMFMLDLTTAQQNGQVLSVIAQDAAGNPSVPLLLDAPDLTPPAPLLDLSLDPSGVSLSGSGEVGTTITVRGADGNLLGETVVPAGGEFIVVLNPPQANGERLTVVAEDAAGNMSVPQTIVALDTTAPAPVSNLMINSNYDQLSGHGEAGATVRVVNGTVLLGTAQVQANGTFQVTLNPEATPGGELTVVQVDAAGNISEEVPYLTPLEPVPAAPIDVQLSIDGLIVSGSAAPDSIIRVYNAAGVQIGNGTAAQNGTFSVTLTQPQLNGQMLEVTAGSSGGESPPFVLMAADITAPELPLVTALSANGLVLSGSGEAGATVTVRTANGELLGSAQVSAVGTFLVNLASPQLNGQVLTVRQADAAGNLSGDVAYTVPDVQAPAAPGNLQLLDGGLRLTGTGEAGALVQVTGRNGVALGSVRVADNGQFELTLNSLQADGQVLTVRQTDRAGNVSASATLTAADTTAPEAPAIVLNAGGTLITGSGEAGTRVTVRSNGAVVGTATVAANGTFLVSLATPQLNHETISVTLTDAAGNVSAATSILAPDITPPALAGNLLINATGTELSGTGEVGATVTVRAADGSILQSGTLIGASGTFNVVLNPPQDNGQRLTVTLTDPRGNVSGNASITAPDIDADTPVVASDNLATAVVNLAPVISSRPPIIDSYTVLVGLNASKAFTWTVGAGTTVNPTLTLSTDNLLGLLSASTFTLQVKDASGAWIELATGTDSALLTLLILPGLGLRANIGTLQAGEYQLVVRSSGLNVLTTINTRLDLESTSLTQFTGSGVAKTGNLISDVGTDGTTDILGPDNAAVLQVLKGGTYVNAGTATTVQGLYGTLVISADGSYTYTPTGSPNSVGKVDVFSYQLVHANGKSDTANLYVRIDSPQATEVWNDANLSAPATVVDAVDDVGRSNVTLVNKITTDSQAFDPINLPLALASRSSVLSHTVATGTSADLQVVLSGTSLLGLLNRASIQLQKLNANGQYETLTTVSGDTIAEVIGVSSRGYTFQGLEAGRYQVTIKASSTLSLGGTINSALNSTTKSLNEFVVNTASTASGNLLTGDTLGSSFTTLSVQTAANTYALPGYNGLSVAGLYGTLLVFADGSYSYTLKSGLSASVVGQVETFTYALTHPNGTVDTAQLKITVAEGPVDTMTPMAHSDDASDGAVLAALAVDGADQQAEDQADAPRHDKAQVAADQAPGEAEPLLAEQGFASVEEGADGGALLWTGGDASIDLASLVGQVHGLEVLDLNATSAVSLTLTLDDVVAVTEAGSGTLLIKGDSNDAVRLGDLWTLSGQEVADGIGYNQYTAQEDPSQQLWVQNGVHVV